MIERESRLSQSKWEIGDVLTSERERTVSPLSACRVLEEFVGVLARSLARS